MSLAMTTSIRLATCVLLTVMMPGGASLSAVTLKRSTVAAFDRYTAETERQSAPSLADPASFLWVDHPDRKKDLEAVRKGELLISRLETRSNGKRIDIPDGLIHHWIGLVFVPGVTVNEAVALLQDYDRHAEIYKPSVARSKLLQRSGGVFRMHLRFYTKKVITVVVNSDHEARFTRPAVDRAYSHIVSTRIAEVENPDEPTEKELPVGDDGGYLWRLNSHWRFLQRDGGTYIQCESITLTRTPPLGLGFIIRPFITGIPKESLTFTLDKTRSALAVRR
jgi:hypothetical protein